LKEIKMNKMEKTITATQRKALIEAIKRQKENKPPSKNRRKINAILGRAQSTPMGERVIGVDASHVANDIGINGTLDDQLKQLAA